MGEREKAKIEEKKGDQRRREDREDPNEMHGDLLEGLKRAQA